MEAPGDAAAFASYAALEFQRASAGAAALMPAALCGYLRLRGARDHELQAYCTALCWQGAATTPPLFAEALRLCDECAPGVNRSAQSWLASRLELLFAAFDADGDGALNKSELTALLGAALLASGAGADVERVKALRRNVAARLLPPGSAAAVALPRAAFVAGAAAALGEPFLRCVLWLPEAAGARFGTAAVAPSPLHHGARAEYGALPVAGSIATAAVLSGASASWIGRPVPRTDADLAQEMLTLLHDTTALTLHTSNNPLWAGNAVYKWAQTPAGAAAAADFMRRFTPLCAAAARLFASRPRVLRVRAPAAVLGDTHGNLADVRRVFAPRLWPGGPLEMQVPVLFLGDYVDRGYNSPELVAYLFAMALAAPARVHLLRGNHECRFRNASAPGGDPRGFGAVCAARYGADAGAALWEAANSAFDFLPLAALIESPAAAVAAAAGASIKRRPAVYCAHGGFGPLPAGHGSTVAALLSQSVPLRNPEAVPVVRDTLWSDPLPAGAEAQCDPAGFCATNGRGGGRPCFSAAAMDAFAARENVALLLRGHSMAQHGVAVAMRARVLTVFSDARDHGQGPVGGSAAAYARVDVEEDWRLVVRPSIVRGL